ncbi:MAG: hypothetical protein H7336_14695 [Bacteriovorax sp.]|nr:hypothetical protein [Bacteriovorax sp.]
MDRNWLIRTSQNQILGPVAKAKLLEFIQKGALGMTDEVASGNGYWFSLKEKDLVEKYIYGDIPQGYNPISESKSVLARRENPDKTSSINNAPANKTQVLKMSNLGPGLVPKSEDLEFPDISSPAKSDAPVLDFGEIQKTPSPAKAAAPVLNLNEAEVTKLPTQDDLEFPDMNAITEDVNQSFKYPSPGQAKSSGGFSARPVQKVEVSSDEEIILPNEDDLAFPDMDMGSASVEDKTSTKVEKGKVDLDHQHTRTVALDNEQAAKIIPEIEEKAPAGGKAHRNIESDLGEMSLSLDLGSKGPAKEEPASMQKKERLQTAQPQVQQEEKKLLHERKTKSSSKPATQRDPAREVAHHKDDQAEPLKKRNDNYIFFILIILILIIVAVFFYFKEILNKPLPV